MLRLIFRKLTLILILTPTLHAVGFYYAQQHPSYYRPRYTDNEDGLSYTAYLKDIFLNQEWGLIGSAPLETVINERLINSLTLILFALTLTAVGGLLIGILSISSQTGQIRPWLFIFTTAGASLPGFLLGGTIIAITVYQILNGNLSKFPFPLSGTGIDNHLILPMIVLATRPTLHLAKLITGLLQEQFQTDHIRTARSKGARPFRVTWRHALPNIWPPIINVLSQSLRFIVGGLLIAEVMFSWPGLGQLFVFSIIVNENLSGPFSFVANPYLVAALFTVVGLLLLTADLIAAVTTRALSPHLSHD